jgi:hypothetical protein
MGAGKESQCNRGAFREGACERSTRHWRDRLPFDRNFFGADQVEE